MWFLEKTIWRVKWRCSKVFPGRFSQNSRLCLMTSLEHFWEANQIQVMPFLILILFSKTYRVSRCGCQMAIFAANNEEQIFVPTKFCWVLRTHSQTYPSTQTHANAKTSWRSSSKNHGEVWRRVILKIELKIKQSKLNPFTVNRDSSSPWSSQTAKCYCGSTLQEIDYDSFH